MFLEGHTSCAMSCHDTKRSAISGYRSVYQSASRTDVHGFPPWLK